MRVNILYFVVMKRNIFFQNSGFHRKMGGRKEEIHL